MAQEQVVDRQHARGLRWHARVSTALVVVGGACAGPALLAHWSGPLIGAAAVAVSARVGALGAVAVAVAAVGVVAWSAKAPMHAPAILVAVVAVGALALARAWLLAPMHAFQDAAPLPGHNDRPADDTDPDDLLAALAHARRLSAINDNYRACARRRRCARIALTAAFGAAFPAIALSLLSPAGVVFASMVAIVGGAVGAVIALREWNVLVATLAMGAAASAVAILGFASGLFALTVVSGPLMVFALAWWALSGGFIAFIADLGDDAVPQRTA
ncbi:MAG TPA: hypothetical protein VEL07_06780 [Planctomycetota bacterium]|nr:hypothetical protein [Planctomycetota bacterium]